jgi:hypothetical protein
MRWQAGDIISGERLQALASITVITHPIVQFHRSLGQSGVEDGALFPGSMTELAADPRGIAALKNRPSIFVYTHLLESFARVVLPRLDHRFVLITHNSDVGIDERFRPLLDDQRIIQHFAQNALIKHPKLTPLPIGIANAQWPHGDIDSLVAVAPPAARRNIVYCNFEIGTNPGVRAPLKQRLMNNPNVWHAPGRPFAEYLSDMAGCRWCVSPPGNGVDCHRTWEALYLGVIPIVQASAAGAALHGGLPIVQLDDLGAIDEAVLARADSKWAGQNLDLRRLSLSYWRQQVAARLSEEAAGRP